MKKIIKFVVALLCCALCLGFTGLDTIDVHAENGGDGNDFYQYVQDHARLRVSLTDEFKAALNQPSATFTGINASGKQVTWKTGDPLPDPDPNGMHDGQAVDSFAYMFYNVEAEKLDLSAFTTTNAADFSGMFGNCYKLSTIPF